MASVWKLVYLILLVWGREWNYRFPDQIHRYNPRNHWKDKAEMSFVLNSLVVGPGRGTTWTSCSAMRTTTT